MKKIRIIILMLIIIIGICEVSFANAGPVLIRGDYLSEVLLIDASSPIAVQNEFLTFDFNQESEYAVRGIVKANYLMNNTGDDNLTVNMAFPYTGKFADLYEEDVSVMIDGEPIDYKVFTGDVIHELDEEIDFNSILSNLSKSGPLDEKLLKGTLYTFNVTSLKEGVMFMVEFDYDDEKTKVISRNFNYGHYTENHIKLGSREYDQSVIQVLILGEDPGLRTYAVTNASQMKLTESYTLMTEVVENIILRNYIRILAEEYFADWVKLTGERMLDFLMEETAYYLKWKITDVDRIMGSAREERLMGIVYEVPFESHEFHEISVTYEVSAEMNHKNTTEPLYKVKYLFNPAAYWSDFKDLTINVILPERVPYMVESNIDFVKDVEGKYSAFLGELPDEDLSFSFYNKESITLSDKVNGSLNSRLYYGATLVKFGISILLISTLVFRIRKMRRR